MIIPDSSRTSFPTLHTSASRGSSISDDNDSSDDDDGLSDNLSVLDKLYIQVVDNDVELTRSEVDYDDDASIETNESSQSSSSITRIALNIMNIMQCCQQGCEIANLPPPSQIQQYGGAIKFHHHGGAINFHHQYFLHYQQQRSFDGSILTHDGHYFPSVSEAESSADSVDKHKVLLIL